MKFDDALATVKDEYARLDELTARLQRELDARHAVTHERLTQAIRDTGLFPHGVPMSPVDSPLGRPMPIQNFAGLLVAALEKER